MLLQTGPIFLSLVPVSLNLFSCLGQDKLSLVFRFGENLFQSNLLLCIVSPLCMRKSCQFSFQLKLTLIDSETGDLNHECMFLSPCLTHNIYSGGEEREGGLLLSLSLSLAAGMNCNSSENGREKR